MAICSKCGSRFRIVLTGDPTPQFCEKCAPDMSGMWNICPICGKLFHVEDNASLTCSPACQQEWDAELSKPVLSNRRGSDSFSKTRREKVWTLVDPEGNEHCTENLEKWIRENAHLFGREPNNKAVKQIRARFSSITKAMRENATEKKYYMGWTLKCLPETQIAQIASTVSRKRKVKTQIAPKWKLLSPKGEEFVFWSLRSWASENCERFGFELSDKSCVKKILNGFNYALKHDKTYQGWKLTRLSEE